MDKNTSPLTRSSDGIFLHSPTAPDSTMSRAMDKIRIQLQKENERRQAIRDGRIASSDWDTWTISDRH